MKLNVGKYHDTELSEIPTDYLEWVPGHLTLSDEMEQAVEAECARRRNAARVEAETPTELLRDRVGRALNKFAAKHGH